MKQGNYIMTAKKFKQLSAALLTSLSLLICSGLSQAAIYVKIPDLPGDVSSSNVDAYGETYFVADSFSFGALRETKESTEKSGGSFSLPVNGKTFALIKALETMGEVDIIIEYVAERGADEQTYLKYKLDRCFVKSWSTSGAADSPPTTRISFSYTEVEVNY